MHFKRGVFQDGILFQDWTTNLLNYIYGTSLYINDFAV